MMRATATISPSPHVLSVLVGIQNTRNRKHTYVCRIHGTKDDEVVGDLVMINLAHKSTTLYIVT